MEHREAQVLLLLRHLKVQLLIRDEIHDIISGSLNRQRYFLNVVKQMGNEREIPIIEVGMYSALNALQTDDQLANRSGPWCCPSGSLARSGSGSWSPSSGGYRSRNPPTWSRSGRGCS